MAPGPARGRVRGPPHPVRTRRNLRRRGARAARWPPPLPGCTTRPTAQCRSRSARLRRRGLPRRTPRHALAPRMPVARRPSARIVRVPDVRQSTTPSSGASCDLPGQLGLGDLAEPRQWELVDEDEPLGPLLLHQPAFVEERAQLIEGDVAMAWRTTHDRTYQLTAQFVGLAQDRDLVDQGVGQQLVLDLVRGDVLALADDQILGAAGDHDAPVWTKVAPVAAAEPPVGG